MAHDGPRGGGFGGRGGRNGDRGGRGGRGGGRFGSLERERDRDRERDRSPLRDERMRDLYMDSYRGGGSGGGGGPRIPPFSQRGDFGPRDPYFQPPYRRLPDPWFGDDPYRRDPYAEPYREPPRARPPPLPVECEIFVLNTHLRAYGEIVERRVKDHNIITAVSVMPEGRTPAQLVEDVTAQNALFAIFINPQNEIHRSLTVNILHGTPQEHRNMPLEDAIVLVGRSFLKYVDSLHEKSQVAAAPLTSSRVFLPPSSEVVYLLNLLADNRAVTVTELDMVIKYLQERREKLIDAESRPILTDADNFGKNQLPQRLEQPQIPSQDNAVALSAGNKDSSATHLELTSKIRNLFSGSGTGVQGVPPANGTQQQMMVQKLPSGAPAPASQAQGQAASGASLINFDNPNVQKALDNLIQNTPNLLKNIGTNMPLPAGQMGAAGMAGNMSASGTPGNMAAAGGVPRNMAAGNMAAGSLSASNLAAANMAGNLAAASMASNLVALASGLFGQGLGMMSGQAQGQAQNNDQNPQGGFGGPQGVTGQGSQGSAQSVYSTGISKQGKGYAPNSQQQQQQRF